jgi:hypothetical protein
MDEFGGMDLSYWDFGDATMGGESITTLANYDDYYADSAPIIDTDFGTTYQGDFGYDDPALQGPQLFVDTTTGNVVNEQGVQVFTQADVDAAMQAYREGERDLAAATPGSPEEQSIWQRINAAFAPINEALKSPLGRTLAMLGIGGVGTALGALAGSGTSAEDALRRLGQQGPALPPSVAAGNASVLNALQGTGAGIPAPGQATGAQNLEEAVRQSLIAQRLGGQYFADQLARESGAEAMESPALTAIRQAAIMDLPSTMAVGPQDRSALLNPLIARGRDLLAGGPEAFTDPVQQRLQALTMELLGVPNYQPGPVGTAGTVAGQGGAAGTPGVIGPAARFAAETWPNYFPGGISHPNAAQYWQSLPQQLKDEAAKHTGTTLPTPGGVPTAQQFAAKTWSNYFPGGPTHPNFAQHWEALPQYLKDEAQKEVALLAAAPPTGTPGTSGSSDPSNPMIAGGRPITDVSPLDDPIQTGLGTELSRAFEGKLANPEMEREIEQGRETLRNQLMQQLGTTTPELTTAGAQRMAEFEFRAKAMREQDRRSIIAAYSPMEESRRRFATEFPEARYQRRLSIVMPEERARSEFAYQAPRNFYMGQLNSLIPMGLSAERDAQANRARRFGETLSLTDLGRRNAVAATGAGSSIFPVSMVANPATAAGNSRAGFDALIASSMAGERERANRASGIANMFTTAATAGLGLGRTNYADLWR